MRTVRTFCVFMAVMAITAFSFAADAVFTTAVDKAIDDALRDKRIVGTVVLICRDGSTVYSRAAGMADREANLAMWKTAIFRLASVSKVNTAMAAAVLLDQGKMRLDDPVTKYLPDFRPALPGGSQPVITVKHLLIFTAGLDYAFAEGNDGPYHRAGVSDGLDNTAISIEENLRRIASAPLLFEPGSEFRYSLALDVMGGVIAAAAGKPFDQAMRDLVWEPLGMSETSFVVKDGYRLATPYFNASPEPQRMGEDELVTLGPMVLQFSPGRAVNPDAYPSGGAGMNSTADDMMKLLECMRQGGSPLISKEMMQQVGKDQIKPLEMMPGVAFGLGVGVIADPSAANVPEPAGSIEWSGAYGNNWWVDAKNGLSVIILTNTAFEGMNGKFIDDVKKAVYGNLDE